MGNTALKFVEPEPKIAETNSVFGADRTILAPDIEIPPGLDLNQRIKMDGLEFLAKLPENSVPVAFFDPQYRGILDKLQYGNEGEKREKRRITLEQMGESTISNFITAIDRVLIPSGHLFLWMDKFHLCSGFQQWMDGTKLDIVDLISWNKGRIGMGYRTRRQTEYCIVLQKQPRRAKGVWQIHNIPDTWLEKSDSRRGHPHSKPIALQNALISAVSKPGDIIIDPAAGGFTVLKAAIECQRNFLGCDLNG